MAYHLWYMSQSEIKQITDDTPQDCWVQFQMIQLTKPVMVLDFTYKQNE